MTTADLISVGVYSALYFVMVTIATFASSLLFGGLANVLLPGLCALISGIVYMLMAVKVHKLGGIMIMGFVVGIFFFVSGHFALSFVPSIVCSIAADLIANSGKYKNKVSLIISYAVFSFGITGPVLPLWFMKDAYIESLVERGKDASYIDPLFANINTATFFVCVGAVIVCAVIGGLFGQKMLKKHFEKAGII